MEIKQIEELVLQSLEHEKGGVAIFTTAVTCAVNPDLKEEWQRYLEQTRTHVASLQQACKALGIDESKETTGRAVVRDLGKALVAAMQTSRAAGDPVAAELVACECVVIAETKDHLDWELLGKVAEQLEGRADVLMATYDKIEDEEDEHLYYTRGWCRELWLQSLGLKALLPPPEEIGHVKTAIGAALAEQAADRQRYHH